MNNTKQNPRISFGDFLCRLFIGGGALLRLSAVDGFVRRVDHFIALLFRTVLAVRYFRRRSYGAVSRTFKSFRSAFGRARVCALFRFACAATAFVARSVPVREYFFAQYFFGGSFRAGFILFCLFVFCVVILFCHDFFPCIQFERICGVLYMM